MNKIAFVGNLTKDPVQSTVLSGKNKATFTVAVNRVYSEDVDFFPVVAWETLAENCAKFLEKGSKVFVTGSLYTKNFTAEDGSKKFAIEVSADDIQFLSSKPQATAEEPKETKKKSGKKQ